MPSKTRGRDWDAAPSQKKAATPIKIVDDSGSDSDGSSSEDDAPSSGRKVPWLPKRATKRPETSGPAKRKKPNPTSSEEDPSDSSSSSSSSSESDEAPALVATPREVAADSSDDDSDSSSSDDDDDGIMGQLKAFVTSSESVLTLVGTSAQDRRAVHSWVENHKDAAVRSYGHVAKAVGTERVMTITKSGPLAAAPKLTKQQPKPAAAAKKVAAKPVAAPAADSSSSDDDSSSSDEEPATKPSTPSPAESSSGSDSDSDESDDDSDDDGEKVEEVKKVIVAKTGVLGQLDRFEKSAETVLTMAVPNGADRANVHTWVEHHKDEAVRGWGHVSKTVGPDKMMTVTKTGASLTKAAKAPAAKPAAPKKVAIAESSSSDDDSSDGDSSDGDSSSVDMEAVAAAAAAAAGSSSDSDDDDDSSGSDSSDDDSSSVDMEAVVAAAAAAAGSSSDSDSDSDDSDDSSDVDMAAVSAAAAAAAAAGSSSDSDSDSGGDDDDDDDDSVVGKLERFAKSGETVLSMAVPNGADRSAVHTWVESHKDEAVRGWGHVSKTVGPDKMMTVTKTGASLTAAKAAAKAAPKKAAPKNVAIAESSSSDDDSSDDDSSSVDMEAVAAAAAAAAGSSSDSDSDSDDSDGSDDDDSDEEEGATGRLASQLKAAEAAKVSAFASNNFAALPALQTEVDRITELLSQPSPAEITKELKAKLKAAEDAKMEAFKSNDFGKLPGLQKEVERLMQLLESARARTPPPSAKKAVVTKTHSDSNTADSRGSPRGGILDEILSSEEDTTADNSSSDSGDGDENPVVSKLKKFQKSRSEVVFVIKDTTAPDRSAIHAWVEDHADPIVRGWGHTSKTVGTERVMTITKSAAAIDSANQKRPASYDDNSDEGEGGGYKRPSKKARKEVADAIAVAESDDSLDSGVRRFENDKHILFIGQLPYDATAEQIQAHFEKETSIEIMGEPLDIIGVRLLTDRVSGKSRGMAFIDCGTEDDLDKGVHMHQSKLLGRRINVEKSASGGGKTERRERFIEKSKVQYDQIRQERVQEALDSRIIKVDHELKEDDIDDEIRGFLLSVPVRVAVSSLLVFSNALCSALLVYTSNLLCSAAAGDV